jgi:phenylacetate-CoA ligase
VIIWSALRNGVRGVLAAGIVYPLAERAEKRDVRRKTAWVRQEIDRPYAERRARAWARLVDLVRFAGTKVPHYRDLFAATGFDPERLAGDPAYYDALPHLTKDIVREQRDRLLRVDREGLRQHVSTTGGSTGPATDIYYDQEAADWSSAVTRESRRRIGNPHWRSELHFASKFPEVFPFEARLREWVKCLAMNRDNAFYDSFDSPGLEALWRQTKAIRPHLLHAHPSTVDQLAMHVEATRGTDRGFAIFESSGELMTAEQRDGLPSVSRTRP